MDYRSLSQQSGCSQKARQELLASFHIWDLGEAKHLNIRRRGFGETDEGKRGEERFRKAIERVARMSILYTYIETSSWNSLLWKQ